MKESELLSSEIKIKKGLMKKKKNRKINSTPKQIKREKEKGIKSLSEKKSAKIGKNSPAFLLFSYN